MPKKVDTEKLNEFATCSFALSIGLAETVKTFAAFLSEKQPLTRNIPGFC